MRNPGMRDRHWHRLTAELGVPGFQAPDEEFSLQHALDMGLEKPALMAIIDEVSAFARSVFLIFNIANIIYLLFIMLPCGAPPMASFRCRTRWTWGWRSRRSWPSSTRSPRSPGPFFKI